MLSAHAQAALVQKAHAGLGGDPLVAIVQGLVPHQSPIYSQAAELVQAARGAGTRHKVDPAYLARLLVGISGGEQSYGLSGAPDVGIKNLWGWGHSPDAASGQAFGSWQDAFNTVAEGLAGNYLSKGLVTPEQIAPVYVGTGDHTDWISTVNKALGGQAPQDVAQAPVLNGGSASGASQLPPLSAGITKPEYVTSKPDVAGFLRALIGRVGQEEPQQQPLGADLVYDFLNPPQTTQIPAPQLTAPAGATVAQDVTQAAAVAPPSTHTTRSDPSSYKIDSKSGYVFPVPDGVKPEWFRTDSGKDFRVPAGTPLGALGPGVVTYLGDGGDYGPEWLIYKLTGGPLKDHYVFIGHSRAAPGVKQGMTFSAGTPLAIATGIGAGGAPLHVGPGWVEMGFAAGPEGPTLAHVTGRDPTTHYSSAGEHFWGLLQQLGAK